MSSMVEAPKGGIERNDGRAAVRERAPLPPRVREEAVTRPTPVWRTAELSMITVPPVMPLVSVNEPVVAIVTEPEPAFSAGLMVVAPGGQRQYCPKRSTDAQGNGGVLIEENVGARAGVESDLAGLSIQGVAVSANVPAGFEGR